MRLGRWSVCVFVVGIFALASLLHAQFTYEPLRYGTSEAQLTVQVASKTEERGLGEVTLTLRVQGPASLEVEEPHLSDAVAAWKEERQPSTRDIENKRATWSETIRLKQSKKGIEPLPDVSLRFRESSDAKWEEAKWVDILKQLRDLPPPAPLPERPSWLQRWGFVLALAATALLVLLLWLGKRRRLRVGTPLTADQWALKEIERIEGNLMPPNGAGEGYHTQLSFIIRRYLTERLGLHALQQTTAEFLETLNHVPQSGTAASAPRLSVEQHALLRELFERCDLAKFAQVSTSPEECRQTTELAREIVRQTSQS